MDALDSDHRFQDAKQKISKPGVHCSRPHLGSQHLWSPLAIQPPSSPIQLICCIICIIVRDSSGTIRIQGHVIGHKSQPSNRYILWSLVYIYTFATTVHNKCHGNIVMTCTKCTKCTYKMNPWLWGLAICTSFLYASQSQPRYLHARPHMNTFVEFGLVYSFTRCMKLSFIIHSLNYNNDKSKFTRVQLLLLLQCVV